MAMSFVLPVECINCPPPDFDKYLAINRSVTLLGGFDPASTGTNTDITYPSPYETVISGLSRAMWQLFPVTVLTCGIYRMHRLLLRIP